MCPFPDRLNIFYICQLCKTTAKEFENLYGFLQYDQAYRAILYCQKCKEWFDDFEIINSPDAFRKQKIEDVTRTFQNIHFYACPKCMGVLERANTLKRHQNANER
jgi:uncharacterized protein YbaR (Trm112 family)